MIQPVRIQRTRQKKQISPNGLPIVYVGRPTKFGNPFKIGYRGLTAYECFDLYGIHVKKISKEDLENLRGKNLSCWCKIGEPCHADILLEIANK